MLECAWRCELKLKKIPTSVLRAVIEMSFIIFLYYSNLLMGEFRQSNSGPDKTWGVAIKDIFTPTNLMIALIAAFLAHVVFEYLRKKTLISK
jgi:hypothetical protein